MSGRTFSTYAGLIVPFAFLDADHRSAGISSLTEATPEPGTPEPDASNVGAMTCYAAGEQTSTAYDLQLVRGGLPVAGSATFQWKTSTASAYQGQDWPTYLHEAIYLGPTGAQIGHWPDAIRLTDGTVLVVHVVEDGFGYKELRAYRIAEDSTVTGATAGSETVILTQDPAADEYFGALGLADFFSGGLVPSVVYLPDLDRVVVYLQVEYVGADILQLVAFSSADDGVTWSLWSGDCLRQPQTTTDRTYSGLAVRRIGDALLMFQCFSISGPDYFVEQWASIDGGISFDLIETVNTDQHRPRAADSEDGRDFYLWTRDISDGIGYVRRFGSPYQLLSETAAVAWATGATGTGTAAYSAGYVDEQGVIWTLAIDGTAQEIWAAYSEDQGATWHAAGYNPFATGTGSDTFEFIAACPRNGGALVLTSLVDAGWDTGAREKLIACQCGGWTTQTLPALASGDDYQHTGRLGMGAPFYGSWEYGADTATWIPLDAPADMGWTAAGTATESNTQTIGSEPYRQIATSAAARSYAWAPTLDFTDGVIFEIDCQITSGGSASTYVARITGDDGASTYTLLLYVGPSAVSVYDAEATATLFSAAIAGTTRRRYRLVARKDSVSLHYLTDTAGASWVTVGAAAPTGTGGTTTAEIQWGLLATETTTIRVWFVGFTCHVGPRDVEGLTHGAVDVLGAPCSARPTYISAGLRVAFSDGPGAPGDAWSLAPAYLYSADYATPSPVPSRSVRWRTTADETASVLGWLTDGPVFLPPVIAGVLYGPITSATLQGRDSSNAWVTLLTWDFTDGLTQGYQAALIGSTSGGMLQPGDATGSRYFARNELAGGHVILDSGTAYTITSNTEGWFDSTATVRCMITVSGWDDTESDTGTVQICPPGCLAVNSKIDTTETYSAFRLSISSAKTATGDYRVKVIAGELHVFSTQYAHGRVISVDPRNVSAEAASGAVFVEAPSALVRTVRFAWTDPYDASRPYADTEEWVLLDSDVGSEAVGLVGAEHLSLQGLLAELQGAYKPIVYVSGLPFDPDGFSTTDPEYFLYGRLVSAIESPRTWGSEQADEVVTVSEIAIREEI